MSVVARLSARALAGRRRQPRAARVLGIGIDLVDVDEVIATLHSDLSERYLSRVYTPREVGDCTDAGTVNAARLAGRFAAKEAVMKALNVADRAVPWRSIEVVRAPGGRPSVSLHGEAAVIAEQTGVSKFALSVSHEASYATAVVVVS